MWTPISLTIKNLFSYQDAHFDFQNNQVTAVYGNNQTDPNTLSNGSGKSSILDCISISILGEPLRKVKKDEIPRNGEDSGETILVLQRGKEELKIRSIINIKESSKVEIYENGVLNKRFKDIKAAEGYKYILSLIGISKDDLMNYFLISKDSYKSFFLSGDTVKKEIINRFSKADIIDNVYPLIETDIATKDAALKKLKDQNIANDSVLAHINEEINQEKVESSIEKTRKLAIQTLNDKIATIEEEIKQLPTKIKEKQDQVQTIDNLIKTGQDNFNSLNKEKNAADLKVTDLEKKITAINDKQSKMDSLYEPLFKDFENRKSIMEAENADYELSIKETNKEIVELDLILQGQIECPKCEHKFILNDKEFDIEEAHSMLKELTELKGEAQKLIVTNDEKLVQLNADREKVNTELSSKNATLISNKALYRKQLNELNTSTIALNKKIKEQETLINQENKKKNQIEIDLNRLNGEQASLLDQIKVHKKAIKEEKDRKYDDKLVDLENKVKGLTEQNEALKTEILKLEGEKNSLLEWEVRFKQFKSFLANTSIATIEDMMNFYLKKMNTNLSVAIDGFRELSNGKLKEEITTLICRDGLNGESFHKFSGGEKSKVNIAGILSMQKIINLTTENGGLNMIFIDEILESADEIVMKSIIKALSLLDQTIMIITHVSPDSSYECNKMQITKINNISMIKEENDIRKVEETEPLQKSRQEDIKTSKEETKPIDKKPKKKSSTV